MTNKADAADRLHATIAYAESVKAAAGVPARESPELAQVLNALRIGRIACEWHGNQQDAEKISKAMDAARALAAGVDTSDEALPPGLIPSPEGFGKLEISPPPTPGPRRVAKVVRRTDGLGSSRGGEQP